MNLFRRGAPKAACPDCGSAHFLPLGTVHEFRVHNAGVDRHQIGYKAQCARCGERYCVTNQGVYRGAGESSRDTRAAAPASRTPEPNGKPPLRTVDPDVVSWRGPST